MAEFYSYSIVPFKFLICRNLLDFTCKQVAVEQYALNALKQLNSCFHRAALTPIDEHHWSDSLSDRDW